MSLLSIIVPCYNEENVISLFYETASKSLAALPAKVEYIFVNDGSKDATLSILKDLKASHEDVHYVSFSRNFGKEAAIFAGLHECKGDAAVVMDSDLQHPIETIHEMYKLWSEGYEVVEGIKQGRGKESAFHGFMSKSFYKLISSFMGIDMNNTSDFKLMDRKVVDTLCTLKERNTFFRALSFWVGYKSTTVSYEVNERAAGVSKWSFGKLAGYAVNNLVSFTFSPLYMIVGVGVVFFVLGLILAIDAVIDYFNGMSVAGYPTLLVLMVISTGAILFSIGVIGVYVAKIYDEIKQRPQYIIDEKE